MGISLCDKSIGVHRGSPKKERQGILMKKAKILCALLSILLLFSVLGVLFSNAYTNIRTVTVNINLTSDKAEATITAYAGTVIEATLKLYRVVGSNKYLLQTWQKSTPTTGSTYLKISESYNYVSGTTYYLEVTGTATLNGYSEPFAKSVTRTA